jgi:competence protein ComEA
VPDLPPRQLAACALAFVAVSLLGAWHLARGGGGEGGGGGAPPAAIRVDDGESEHGSRVIVHVAGAVRRPGVYRMRPAARVDDAVGRAGGATRRADLSQVNLAAKVEDGRQVVVPEKARASAAGTPTEPTPGVPLNLNTATLEELDELDGIGPATAQSILDYRDEHGGFGSVEELGEVPGIGDVRLASLREQVRV